MIGETVGSYRVESKLGEGGMGVVYIAEHPLLRKKAVVKFLHAELSSDGETVERFFNEARSATMIRHPGIVDVFDFGHHASGCAFILMEFLDGESLADRVHDGPLDATTAVLIGRQIASAVGAAHDKGIIHRDLKPDNVFLVTDNEAAGGMRVKVLDFGIAKLAGESSGSVKTQTGAVMGTPSYMAPEQCRSAGEVDRRADVYSLGCILFELMCGRPPFRTSSLGQLIAAHMFEAPPEPSSLGLVPADLERVILRALAKEADDRQQSMGELAAELGACDVTTLPPPRAKIPRVPTGFEQTVAPMAAATAPARLTIGSTTIGQSIGQMTTPDIAPPVRPTRVPWMIGVGVAVALVAGVVIWQRGDSANEPAAEPTALPAPPPAAMRAPPPAVTPAPPPAVPKVLLVIASDPTGADVIQEYDGMRIGHTPYERSLAPVAKGTLIYILKLEGYEDARVELAADRDGMQRVALHPVKKSIPRFQPPRTPPSAPPVKEEPRTAPSGDGMLRPKS